MRIVRTNEEINKVLDWTWDDGGQPHYPGMTYEEGVRAAIDWITGQTDDNPAAE